MASCSYCGGPITGGGHAGRPWPGRAPGIYCCYGCLSLGEQSRQEAAISPAPDAPRGAFDWVGVRLGIGLIVVAQSMIFGLALNIHDDVPPAVRDVAQSIILAATLLVIVLLGGPLFRVARAELSRGRLTIEALFLLTMAGAMGASLQAFITGRGKIYFEVVSVLLVVYTLGKLIGARSRAAAVAGSRAWAGQLATCRLVDDKGRVRTSNVTDILPGDVVEVNPGETFAVDGVIRAGTGFVSEAAVSGEPFAVVRRPGDRVLAGAASHDATFRVEATAPGTARQIDRLLAAVEEARDRPVSLQGQADRLGQWFFPLVVFTALGTFAYWTLLTPAGWEVGLFNAMSVLLVACPCVIGLATPIVIWTALGRLAERGVIVRAGDAVEQLAAVDRVMLDKTGTLTDDSFALLDIATIATGDERAKLLGRLAVIQEHSRHPVARAFARLPRPDAEPRVLSLRAVSGCGVEADLEEDGARHAFRIGTPDWIGGNPELERQLKAAGHRVHVAVNGTVVAVAVLAEYLRDSALEAVAEFRRLGLPVEVLTGDTAARAAALGLPTRAGLLPDDKRAAVEEAKAAGGKPLFVGDGINDAAALATAHAGVALAAGTDLAVDAADVTLYHTDLRALPWAVELSREAVRAVRRSLYRALGYNLIGMTLAACGILHPVVAAVLMVVSSLSLIFSSTRVGVTPDHCRPIPEPVSNTQEASAPRSVLGTVIHGVAFTLQGLVFLLLVESARELPAAVVVPGAFAVAGFALARLWWRWATIPHTFDMCFGMLTLGNLGMLLGWWADNEFAPLHGHCRECVAALQGDLGRAPWMWVGMLALANVAMIWLPRHPTGRGLGHTIAMYTGGNVGMILGMAAGAWCAAEYEAETVATAVVASFAGMTVGMLAGMLLGTWLIERVLGAARALRHIPRWLRGGASSVPDEVVGGQAEADRDDRVADVARG